MDRRKRNAYPRKRARVRQTLTVIAVGVALGSSLFATGKYVAALQRTGAPGAAAVAAVPDDEIYTGSILYMPEEGRRCHQLFFYNLTGRFFDNGYVDCVAAAYHSPNEPKLWSAARAHVISTGFRDR